ncbi:hypothetical protein IWQ56_003970, partial [Coemansia nantahalensis]
VSDSGVPIDDQLGLSVFIMINYMSLAHPVVLTLVTQALFPELLADLPQAGAGTADMELSSGNNYELLLEIASIVGQVVTTTVSQGLVDKALREYRYEGVGADQGAPEAAVARCIVDDGEGEGEAVHLVAADCCPVCLEGYEPGDVLRVLACRHGLHKTCGDAWFTQGANRCPICRLEAVSAPPAATA